MEKHWGFYGRNSELAEIEKIISSGRWFFCAISGRRRIGKTTLIQRALKQRPDIQHFYFQVPDSDERGVVQAFQEALEDQGVDTPTAQKIHTFSDMAYLICGLCEIGFIATIDEFQYFHRKGLSPFTSFLQAEVDKLRDTKKGGLFVLGSIHTEMTAILEDHDSPLFNRVTNRISIDHWDFETLFEMFDAHEVEGARHWLFLWAIFEGVPKFYRDCFDQGILSLRDDYRQSTLLNLFFEGSSPLRDEATNWFLRELRGRYDSVLKILANRGPCSYSDLKSEYGRAGSGGEKQLGGYLSTLTDRYQMVEKLQPIFAGKSSRKARYVITDNFLAAWLKAISRNVQMARVQPKPKPLERTDKMLAVHEGYAFEKMIRHLTEEASQKGVGDFELTDIIRGYWNKVDGSDIEIDLVASNEDARIVRFGSCKRDADAHTGQSLKKFATHIDRFLRTKEGKQFTGWTVEKALYSPEFTAKQRKSLGEKEYLCIDLLDFRRVLYG
ncbi:MAG: ATP-binding protein [Proteobacteria bacterium]|nr:ATP-binding protein [Pseudomonadota bacterium]